MITFDINFFKASGMKITDGAFDWFPLSESMTEIRMLPDDFFIDIRYNESDEVSQWKVSEAIRVLTSPWRHTKSWRPSVSNFKALEETNTIPTETQEEKEALDAIEKTYRYEKVTDSIFDLKAEFERGELFSKNKKGKHYQIKGESWLVSAANNGNVYRRIEAKSRYEKIKTVFSLDVDLMHSGEYGELDDHGVFYRCSNEFELVGSLTRNKLYRRIEVTERELFIEAIGNLADRFRAWKGLEPVDDLDRDFYDYLFDSGDFKLVNGKG